MLTLTDQVNLAEHSSCRLQLMDIRDSPCLTCTFGFGKSAVKILAIGVL